MNLIYVNAGNTPYALDLRRAFTGQLSLQEVRILADTTVTAITILLPSISDFPQQNVKIFVTDYLGQAATRNIALVANGSDTINGSGTLLINTNNGFAELQIGSTGEWVVNTNGGGGGSSSGVQAPIKFTPTPGVLTYQGTNPLGVGYVAALAAFVSGAVVDSVFDDSSILTPPFYTPAVQSITFQGISFAGTEYIVINWHL